MRTIVALPVALLLAAALTTACGDKYNVDKRPQIVVKVNGNEIAYDPATDRFAFPPVDPGPLAVPVSVSVEIVNDGEAPLTVQLPTILGSVEAGTANRYVSLDWTRSYIDSWPHAVAPGIDGEPVVFDLIYSPSEPLDDTPTQVVIESDDWYGKERIVLTFDAVAQAPAVSVYPGSHTFRNATQAVAEDVTFQIDNEGSVPLRIEEVRLENPDDPEFDVLNPPNRGTEIAPAGTPNYASVSFQVRYQPVDAFDPSNPDRAKVLVVTNDPNHGTVEISLSAASRTATYEISYEDMALGYLDFTAVDTSEETATKKVTVANLGPGALAFREARITPPGAAPRYGITVQRPATGPDEEPDVLCTPADPTACPSAVRPVSIQEGRTLEILVTYTAPLDPVEAGAGINGSLELDMALPNPVTERLAMLAGSPKPLFDLGPADRALHFYAPAGGTAEGALVIYNNGNADLVITHVALYDKWRPETEPSARFTALLNVPDNTVVGPFSLLTVPIRYAPTTSNDKADEAYFDIDYQDSLAGPQSASMNLFGHTSGLDGRPVANPGSYAGARVGSPVSLDGNGSSGGNYELFNQGYHWYLSAKPMGALAALNMVGGPTTQFVPDRPGTYTVRLFVYGLSGSDFYFSDPASVDIVVAE